MNILESQVNDINYLVDSPISPITPAPRHTSMNGQRQSSSAESPAETAPGSGKKRKNDDSSTNANGNTHTRAKRNRYISIAWYVAVCTFLFRSQSIQDIVTVSSNANSRFTATNASVVRSNATEIHLAKDAATSISNASMRRTAVRMASRSPRNSDR